MKFRNLFLSLFLVFVAGFALVHAEDAKPRGPKITNKVRNYLFLSRISGAGMGLIMFLNRYTSISSTEISHWAVLCLDCMERLFLR